jgi:8-oxo-dGTP pyrophosphatase MutT (NUDIX family)
MRLLATFNEHEIGPTDYQDRPTVRAIITNEADEVLLFSSALPGGGVEEGETPEEALRRECMEELGATIEIIRELGTVISYRDVIKRRYVITGYECRLISLGVPTTIFEHEREQSIGWEKIDTVILYMTQHAEMVKAKGMNIYEGDRYQRHIQHALAGALFLKQLKR